MTENKSTIQTAAGVPERERAVLVAVVRDSQELRQSEEYLDELEFLAETADITTVRRFSQRDRKSTRLNSSHIEESRMPSSA